jgi:hypothetical protein
VGPWGNEAIRADWHAGAAADDAKGLPAEASPQDEKAA